MKLIGLIGGMSWQSSAEYYRLINELVGQKLGGHHSARLLLYSVDFDPIEKAQHEGRWDRLADMLGEAACALQKAGADFLVLCTNTMHKVADTVSQISSLPLVHIVDATAEAIQQAGLRRIGLLGTRFTMEDGFYSARLQERFGIETLIPPERDRADVHRVIYDELCHGQVRQESRELYQAVISRLVAGGAEGVVLGCTEIPLLIGPQDTEVPVVDTTRVHAEAVVTLALGSESGRPQGSSGG
ncbi:MAG TPA: aspartate/glutamate racemase family protein [Phycisphaerae bacterium]|nr:aspartate/glutamate racemase family protein [Phycisphaerae bacterium]